MSAASNRLKAAPQIRRLEQLGGIKFSAADRADLKDINTLIKTGDLAVENLTPEVTGAFDSAYRRAKSYLFAEVDETDKLAAQSAYSAFRNTTRHALFGSALTDGEIKAFNEAFGTLAQKFPAVMTQFKTALIQTKSKLQTIYESNDPVLAHYYMGKNAGKLEDIIREIDNRLELFEATDGERVTELPGPVTEQPQETESLESIFGPRTQQ